MGSSALQLKKSVAKVAELDGSPLTKLLDPRMPPPYHRPIIHPTYLQALDPRKSLSEMKVLTTRTLHMHVKKYICMYPMKFSFINP